LSIYRHYFLFILMLVLAGCTTIKPPPSQPPAASSAQQQHLTTLAHIKTFSLKGRLGVVTNPRGFSGSIEWQHQTDTDSVDVYSPLGGKVANIAKTPTEVTLTSQDGRTLSAADAESLTESAMGFRLPLTGLSDWALGRPTLSKIDALSSDAQGRLLTLKQDGWDISYENYAQTNGVDLPGKIVLKSEKLNLKLLVQQWGSLDIK
jgi:outer membrane lipoprotein LolB